MSEGYKVEIMNTLCVTKKEFFDYVVLKGQESALDYYFRDGNNVKFEDGKVYKTKEELESYLNEREKQIQDVIEGLSHNVFE